MNHSDLEQKTPEERIQHYQARRAARLQKRRRKQLTLHLIQGGIALFLLTLLLIFAFKGCTANAIYTAPTNNTMSQQTFLPDNRPISVDNVQFAPGFSFTATTNTAQLDDSNVVSAHALLLDVNHNTVIAQKDAEAVICPASMTKVLTLLVAAESINDLDAPVTISREMTDYVFQNKCSAVGFLDEETVPVRDLLYGTILPSGGDAAIALATFVAGSQDAFVTKMNQKLDQLGLSETAHFTNCIGLYDPMHYCTLYDMAVIMKAALQNDLCREVLSTHTYTTAQTVQHPDGITISNWFLRRIEDKETTGTVVSAKTGFVNQSGNCAVSYFLSASNTPYIAVTVNTYSSWRCIYDHVALYSLYAK